MGHVLLVRPIVPDGRRVVSRLGEPAKSLWQASRRDCRPDCLSSVLTLVASLPSSLSYPTTARRHDRQGGGGPVMAREYHVPDDDYELFRTIQASRRSYCPPQGSFLSFPLSPLL
jgi:hypothetical protein